jgi:ParB/RepB/Spo0J family partition protein
MEVGMSEQTVVQLDPSKVQTANTVRFSLKPHAVDSLAESILELGGVLEPVLVEELKPAVNGHTHRLIAGFHRHAAVEKLNREQSAGLTLPAIVRSPADEVSRLREQVSENVKRESMSPMDSAIAIKSLMDAGVSKKEIRALFARPGGKGKGLKVSPASNSWVNIIVSLLDLPKTIQEKIHTGVIGLEAAYELGKVSPDKRAAVIARAEAEYDRQQEVEQKDEEKYLASVAKLEKAQATEQEAVSQVDGARKAVVQAQELVKAKDEVLKGLLHEPYMSYDEKAKADYKERLKAAETDQKGAQKTLKDAQNEVAKLLKTAEKAAETAKEQRARLEAARKAKPANKKPIGVADVKKAAAAEGAAPVPPLNNSEKSDAVAELSQAKQYPKVAAIGKAILKCFNGGPTYKELVLLVAEVTGEYKPPKVKG